MNKFFVELITPERKFFEGEVVSITVETGDGQLQILAAHSPIVVSLVPGVVTIDDGVTKREAAYSQGFLEVRKDAAAMLCQTIEWPDEIEVNLVEREIEEQERKLREAKSLYEYKFGQATLARAFARLKVKK